MFGLAEWEDETRQEGIRQSSTGKAADHAGHLLSTGDARHEGRSQFPVTT